MTFATSPEANVNCRQQVKKLGKWFVISFIYSGLKWCFSGTGDECGMDNLPSLGIKAKFWNWYCDFR